jgi:hypothetical protein
MLLERSAYLSPQNDSEAVELALDRIWLDWEGKQLATPKGVQIGVDQAVKKIITETQKVLA